jgi:penicillin-binding protein 2
MTDNSRVRISLIGVVIVALFSALLVRLWFLQVGPDQNAALPPAKQSLGTILTDSPRGRILDRTGTFVLAEDRASWAITVDRNLSKRTHARVMGQLSELLGTPLPTLEKGFTDVQQSPLKPAVVARDVPEDKRLAIRERQEDFPGVGVMRLWVRTYPAAAELHDPTLAAQVLGYVGEIDKDQLAKLKSQGYVAGDKVGKDGIEAAYESVLHGQPQVETVELDPTGKQVGPPIKIVPGSAGDDVYLSIDARAQVAAESALDQGITIARTQRDKTIKTRLAFDQAPAGAVVVLDANTGAVVAMASSPSFPASAWANGISQTALDALNSPAAHQPLLNRVTEGQYAPGSAFKLVTSVAATRYGIRGAYEPYLDTGGITISGEKFSNDGNQSYGSVGLQQALTVSSDAYFYTEGNAFWIRYHNHLPDGLGIQQVAREFGFGSPTGIEIPEASGRIPDPTWKKNFATAYYKSEADQQANSIWYPGDNVHLAVGQGDVLVTPLQLADAYAAFANGGTLWTPHLGLRVVDPSTRRVVRTIEPKKRGFVSIPEEVRAPMRAGFEGVVSSMQPEGTAQLAFQGMPVPVAGKTGTAQVYGKAPTSVFASYFPANAPRYVAVAMIEQAGYGADIAAPIVRQVIETMSGIKPVTPIRVAPNQHD